MFWVQMKFWGTWWTPKYFHSRSHQFEGDDNAFQRSGALTPQNLLNILYRFSRWTKSIKYHWNESQTCIQWKSDQLHNTLARWWLNQPNWKIWVKMGDFLPQKGVKTQNIWNHHLAGFLFTCFTWKNHQPFKWGSNHLPNLPCFRFQRLLPVTLKLSVMSP